MYTPNELKRRAIEFSREHANDSSEISEKQIFWYEFFAIFGISSKRVGVFENRAKTLRDTVGFIDFFWPGTLLVEHKSRGEDLDIALKQALDYCVSKSLKEEELPRFVIVCDFARFRIVDLVAYRSTEAQQDFVEMRADLARETPLYIEFPLEALHENLHRFNFILGYEQRLYKAEDPVNIEAAELMGALHDELKEAGFTGHNLELFLVRLMFCFFADDTGIFPRDQFSWLVESHTQENGRDLGPFLALVFQVLNTPVDCRMKTLDADISLLPYVNGGLFSEVLPLPSFNKEMTTIFMKCCHFDWSRVSPAIFGSLFQSVMDAEARRNLGAHYTSEKNIMKTIHGLFLDEYVEILNQARGNVKKLTAFLERIKNTMILDPACGCGNFLILSYRELRLLEIETHKEIQRLENHKYLDLDLYRGLDVENMYGIEIEEFPAQIARTALWIMDHLMNVRLSEEFGEYIVRLPLTSTPHIVQDDALRLDWKTLVSPEKLSFILGNPPFVGKQFRNNAQNADMDIVFSGRISNYGILDFVTAWYVKAAEYIKGTKIRCAFVSTNSITQGEQAGIIWPWLYRTGISIDFAHRTFRWTNEARGVAAVFVVIVGFSQKGSRKGNAVIYDYHDVNADPLAISVGNINPYLSSGADLVVSTRTTPIDSSTLPISFGNMPNDGGNLLFTPEEKDEFLKHEPAAAPYFRHFVGSDEFINGIDRYCLWLFDADPSKIQLLPLVRERVKAVREYRLKSKREATRKLAGTPMLFGEIRQKPGKSILIPSTSSERRQFIPMGFIDYSNTIISNACLFIPNADMWYFGILESTMHMAWMRQVCGRLEGRYRYSNNIVYNNFPWPSAPSKGHKEAVKTAAQEILDARAQYPNATLAVLYDPDLMPPSLVKAHRHLDAVVDKCYRKEPFKSELERVEYLFSLYEKQTTGLIVGTKSSHRTQQRRLG